MKLLFTIVGHSDRIILVTDRAAVYQNKVAISYGVLK